MATWFDPVRSSDSNIRHTFVRQTPDAAFPVPSESRMILFIACPCTMMDRARKRSRPHIPPSREQASIVQFTQLSKENAIYGCVSGPGEKVPLN
jgi:hypothetical protein